MLGGAALTAGALPVLSHQAAAQDDLVVPNSLQNFKRGTIHSIHPELRSFTIIWEDLGRVKMKAADLVTNFPQLKVGQIVDVHWYDYMDFLIAKKTPATVARGKAMMAKGARLAGHSRRPGADQPVEHGRHGHQGRSGDQHHLPDQCLRRRARQARRPTAARSSRCRRSSRLPARPRSRTLQPGDVITTVLSQQTAIKATIIR